MKRFNLKSKQIYSQKVLQDSSQLRIQGSGKRVLETWFRIQKFTGFRVQGLIGFRVKVLGLNTRMYMVQVTRLI
jgi:hypothetical protein